MRRLSSGLPATAAGPLSPPWRTSAREVSFSLPLARASPWHPPHFSTRRGRTSFSKNSASAAVGSAVRATGVADRKQKIAEPSASTVPYLKARLVCPVCHAGVEEEGPSHLGYSRRVRIATPRKIRMQEASGAAQLPILSAAPARTKDRRPPEPGRVAKGADQSAVIRSSGRCVRRRLAALRCALRWGGPARATDLALGAAVAATSLPPKRFDQTSLRRGCWTGADTSAL